MAGLIKRKNNYYAVYYVGGRERRRSLDTSSHQVAKERLLNLEIALAGGDPDSILPTKTPLADLVAAYCLHIQANKTKNSIKVDTWYLRSIFGSICPALEIKSTRGRKKDQQKKPREKGLCLEVLYIEHITTAMIAEMIDTKVQRNGIGPKTANRYREIMMRFITWAMDQRGVRMPGGVNPAIKVERRRQPATKIRFLSLDKIEEQLNILEEHPQLQVMVATYIYAGLRREELLWLTTDDMEFNAGRYGMIRVQAKTVQGEHWEPKTKVNRAIPISSTLRDILDRYHPKKVKGGLVLSQQTGEALGSG